MDDVVADDDRLQLLSFDNDAEHNDEQHLFGLAQHISCPLCGDFLSDAVTLTECCFNSFCRSCLLRYLSAQNASSNCYPCPNPKCDEQLGPEKPIFRHDVALQELVYKLVPNIFWRRLARLARSRRYSSRPNASASLCASSVVQRHRLRRQRLLHLSTSLCAPDEKISMQIDYVPLADILAAANHPHRQTAPEGANGAATDAGGGDHAPSASPCCSSSTSSSTSPTARGGGALPLAVRSGSGTKHPPLFRRFFRCAARVSIAQLKQLLELKLAMTDAYGVYFVDATLQNVLEDDYTLEDIVHLFNWSRQSPLLLHFTLAKLSPEEEEDKPPVLEEMPQLEVEEGEQPAALATVVVRTEKVDDRGVKVTAAEDEPRGATMDFVGGGGTEDSGKGNRDGEEQHKRGGQQEKQTAVTNNSPLAQTVPEAPAPSPPHHQPCHIPSTSAAEAMPQKPSVAPLSQNVSQCDNTRKERKKGKKNDTSDECEKQMNLLAPNKGNKEAVEVPKKRKAPQKRADKETTTKKRRIVEEETKDGEGKTSDQAEGREEEADKQQQRARENRKVGRDSSSSSDNDKNSGGTDQNANDQQQKEKKESDRNTSMEQQKKEDPKGREEKTGAADGQKQQQKQNAVSTFSNQRYEQSLVPNGITNTAQQQQMPTVPSAEQQQCKQKAAPARLDNASSTNSGQPMQPQQQQKQQRKKKPSALSATTTTKTQAQQQYNPTNAQPHHHFMQQQHHHLPQYAAVGGGLSVPASSSFPSQMAPPLAPPAMAAAYAPFLQNFMNSGGGAAFGAMLAALQQPQQQQHNQLSQFVGGLMSMASAAGKTPTTTQHQQEVELQRKAVPKPPTAATTPATTTKATSSSSRGGMSSMRGGTNSATNGNTAAAISKGTGGGGKSPLKVTTSGREDRPSMVGQAPTSSGKNGTTAGHTMEQQHKYHHQQKTPFTGQANRHAATASVQQQKATTLPG